MSNMDKRRDRPRDKRRDKRLYRSERDRMLAGVCGGLGDYFGLDATLVRVGFVLLSLFGPGMLLYVALWIVVPAESKLDRPPPDTAREGVAEIRESAEKAVSSVREAFVSRDGDDRRDTG